MRHILHHYSITQQAHALSSAESEFYGYGALAAHLLFTKHLMEEMFGGVATVILEEDSSAAKGMCLRRGAGRTRHLEVRDLWIQDRVGKGELRIHEIDGALNRADLGTKELPVQRFEFLLKLCQFGLEWGTSQTGAALVLTSLPTIAEAVQAEHCVTAEVKLSVLTEFFVVILQYFLQLLAAVGFFQWCCYGLGRRVVSVQGRAQQEVGLQTDGPSLSEAEVQAVPEVPDEKFGSATGSSGGDARIKVVETIDEQSLVDVSKYHPDVKEAKGVPLHAADKLDMVYEYGRMTVPLLKRELSWRRVPSTGIKSELVQRILNHDAASGPPSDSQKKYVRHLCYYLGEQVGVSVPVSAFTSKVVCSIFLDALVQKKQNEKKSD